MSDVKLPFYLQRPELNLRPISEFEDIHFWLNKPEYIEDPNKTKMSNYLYIARKGRIGIVFWCVKDGLFGKKNKYKRIIPCDFDSIEKHSDHFVCYKKERKVFYDLKGTILK